MDGLWLLAWAPTPGRPRASWEEVEVTEETEEVREWRLQVGRVLSGGEVLEPATWIRGSGLMTSWMGNRFHPGPQRPLVARGTNVLRVSPGQPGKSLSIPLPVSDLSVSAPSLVSSSPGLLVGGGLAPAPVMAAGVGSLGSSVASIGGLGVLGMGDGNVLLHHLLAVLVASGRDMGSRGPGAAPARGPANTGGGSANACRGGGDG